MNKFWKITGVITVFVAVFAFAGVTAAFAQWTNQPSGNIPPAVTQGQNNDLTGLGLQSVDEAAMHTAIADALGITFEAFEAEVANGENAYTLAQKLGVDFAVVQVAMDAVHKAAFLQATNDGIVSQEQADWILSRRGSQSSQGAAMNRGQNNGFTGMMVRDVGNSYYGTGECLYQTP